MSDRDALLKTSDVVIGVLAAAGFAAFVVAGIAGPPSPQSAAAPEPAIIDTPAASPDPADQPGDAPETPDTGGPAPATADPGSPEPGDAAVSGPAATGADPGGTAPPLAGSAPPGARPILAPAPPPQVPADPTGAGPTPLPTLGPASVPRVDPTQSGGGLSGPGSSGPVNPALIPRNPTMQFIVRLTGEDRLKFRDAFLSDPDRARAEFARWAAQYPAFEGMELRRVAFNGELTLVYAAEPGLDADAMTALSQRLAARMQSHPTVDYADPDTLGGKGEAE